MTLVVGRVTSDIGFLVGDTLLSFEYDLKGVERLVNGESHTLKILILNRDTAIAFSGDVTTSLNVINNLHAELRSGPRTIVCDRLFEIYKEVSNIIDRPSDNCEFLVLQLTPKGRRLAHITNEGVRHCDSAYIGDPVEYKRMIALRHPYNPPKLRYVQQPDRTFRVVPLVESEGAIEFAEVSDAIQELTYRRLRSGSVGAICGCVTRVADARISGKLEYFQTIEASISPWEAESGFSVLTSNCEVRGVGIYYRAGKMGFVFVVGDTAHARKECAETLSKFVEIAEEKYGLKLTGGTFNC